MGRVWWFGSLVVGWLGGLRGGLVVLEYFEIFENIDNIECFGATGAPKGALPPSRAPRAQKNVRLMRTRSFENLVEGRRFELPTS